MPEQPQTPSGWLPPQAPEGKPPPRFEPPAYQPPRAPSSPVAPVTPPAAADRPTFVTRSGARTAPGTDGKANTLAVASVVAGILGLLLLVFSLGLGFFFALPCSIAAWLLAVHAKRRIADGRGSTGAGQAQAGLMMGMVGVALGVVAMVVWVALIASGFSIEGFQRDLERKLEQQRDSGAQRTSVPTVPRSFRGVL